MFEMPKHPRTIGQVLDNGFKLYTGTFRSVLPLAVLTALLPMSLAVAMISEAINPMTALFWIVVITVSLVNLGVLNAILFKLDRGAHNQHPGFGAAIKHGFNRLPAAFGASLLYVLILSVATGAAVAPVLLLSLSPYFLFAAAVVASFFLLALLFYYPAVVIDGDGPVSSIVRSYRLVWGNWWRSSAVMAVPLLIFIVVYVAIFTVVGVLVGMGQLGSPIVVQLLVQVVSNALSVVLMPVLYAIVMAQYYDLKLRKEGGDLAGRIKGG